MKIVSSRLDCCPYCGSRSSSCWVNTNNSSPISWDFNGFDNVNRRLPEVVYKSRSLYEIPVESGSLFKASIPFFLELGFLVLGNVGVFENRELTEGNILPTLLHF